jgi:hypothetical protein
VRSGASSFNLQYPLVSWRSSNSCWSLFARLPITYIYSSIACYRRQFLRNVWPIQFTRPSSLCTCKNGTIKILNENCVCINCLTFHQFSRNIHLNYQILFPYRSIRAQEAQQVPPLHHKLHYIRTAVSPAYNPTTEYSAHYTGTWKFRSVKLRTVLYYVWVSYAMGRYH